MRHILLSCLLTAGMTTAWAESFTIGDFEYEVISFPGVGISTGEVSVKAAPEAELWGKLIIPSSVNYEDNTFNVVSIADYGFINQPDILSVTFPESVTEIGKSAFSRCGSMRIVNLPAGLQTLGSGAFQLCTALTEISIPYGTVTIGSYAFSGCSSLSKVTLPTIAEIEAGTFYQTPALNQIELPESLQKIGSLAFANSGLEGILSFPESLTDIEDSAFAYNPGITMLDFPASLRHIGETAFASCTALAEINLKDSEAALSQGVFENCTGLRKVRLNDAVTSFPAFLFSGCSGLSEITLPEGLKTIESFAFHGCSGLESLTLPYSLEVIEERGFQGCSGIKELKIESRDLTLQEGAFQNLYSLPNVYLKGITKIGVEAFANCSSLEWVQFDANLEEIETKAFTNCSNLKEIFTPVEWPPVIGINTFDTATENTATLIVPEGSGKIYSLAAYWSRFLKIEETADFPCSSDPVGIEEVMVEIKDQTINILLPVRSDISIYDMSGIKIGGEAECSEYLITLPKGVYILRVGNKGMKICL